MGHTLGCRDIPRCMPATYRGKPGPNDRGLLQGLTRGHLGMPHPVVSTGMHQLLNHFGRGLSVHHISTFCTPVWALNFMMFPHSGPLTISQFCIYDLFFNTIAADFVWLRLKSSVRLSLGLSAQQIPSPQAWVSPSVAVRVATPPQAVGVQPATSHNDLPLLGAHTTAKQCSKGVDGKTGVCCAEEAIQRGGRSPGSAIIVVNCPT